MTEAVLKLERANLGGGVGRTLDATAVFLMRRARRWWVTNRSVQATLHYSISKVQAPLIVTTLMIERGICRIPPARLFRRESGLRPYGWARVGARARRH